jgi:hypothetical protein
MYLGVPVQGKTFSAAAGTAGTAVRIPAVRVTPQRSLEEKIAFVLYALGLAAQPLMGLFFWSRTWDDSAITLGFARTFVLGGRIEPTVGSGIVEGYSTTLWMLLMAAVAKISTSPYFLLTIAKLSTILLNMLNVVLVRKFAARYQPAALAALIAGVFGLQNITIYESINGMEGPISLSLLMLVILSLRRPGRLPAFTFCAAGALFVLTRWEAAWFLVPLLLLERPLKTMAAGAVTWALTFVSSNFARWRYFGSFVPNTVIAKSGPPYSNLNVHAELSRHISAMTHVGKAVSPLLFLLFALLILGHASFLGHLRRWTRAIGRAQILALPESRLDIAVLLSLLLFGGILALAVGVNWGPPNRMLFPVWPLLLYLILVTAWNISNRQSLRWQFSLAVLLVMMGNLAFLAKELARPDAPLYMPSTTVNNMARVVPELERVRAAASQPDLLFAGEDMGGLILFSNHIRVVDIGLLLDSRLARTRYAGFQHYIFDQRRPAVIETHLMWTELTGIGHCPELYDRYEVLYVGDYRFFVTKELLSKIPNDELIPGTYDANGRPAFSRNPSAAPVRNPAPDEQLNLRFGKYFVLRDGQNRAAEKG